MYKSVQYAYPTSDNAKKLGYYHDGCYCVEIRETWDAIPNAIAGFTTAKKAFEYASQLPQKWHRFTLSPKIDKINTGYRKGTEQPYYVTWMENGEDKIEYFYRPESAKCVKRLFEAIAANWFASLTR